MLTTQEAPDTSVCSITTKQSDGSYTGVYHVGEVGNTDIKFNVKPTVASTMSDDGLTKTVYNSTSYTLNINAFTSDYETPDDITDDDENDTTTGNTEDVSKDNASDNSTIDNDTSTDTNEDNSSTEQNNQKETKGSNSWYIYVIIVLVIVAIAGVTVFIIYKKKE